MNKIIITLIACGALALLAGPPSGKVTLAWDYPTNELTTNLVFKLYHSTNIVAPLGTWTVLTNVVGTNLSVSVVVTPGVNFFAMTASNLWGESDFSNVAETPALPSSGTGLKVKRGD